MTHLELIENLIDELALRVGVPDIKNKEHQSIMSEILTEWGEFDRKEIIFSFLNEAPNDNQTSDTEGEDKDYSHIGRGIYVRKGDEEKEGAQKYKKNDAGKLQPISADEYEKMKADQGEEGEDAASAQNAQKSAQANAGEEEKQPETGTSLQTPDYQEKTKREQEIQKQIDAEKKSKNEPASEKRFEKKDQVILKRVREQIEKNSVVLSDEQKKIANDVLDLTEKLFDETISDEEKIGIANELRDKFKISTNAGNTKYYINALGKSRKLFGDGTKATERLVEQIKKYTQLDQVDFSGIKKNLTAAAKPDMGKNFEVKPKDDERIKSLFQSSPILGRIRESQHGIFAPKDENGNVLFPSNQYTKQYLEQSFNNPALKNTIELVKDYVNKGLVSKDFLDALEKHQKRLQGILNSFGAPSANLANGIGDSYNDLMVDLHNSDPELAGAVMKQLAENRLYEEELAKGEEVYLPSNGSFPGGDIIKIKNDTLERVSLVSCKFGKEGRTYGCPANMKAVTQLHPDVSKRDLFGQYVGEEGFTMMVRDDLIEGETEEETQKKIQKLVKDSLMNQGLSDLFNQDELEELSKMCSEYFYKLQTARVKLQSEMGKVKADVFWGEYQKELSKFKKDFQVRIQKIVTADKLEKIVGKNNVPNFKTRMTPDVFLSGVLLAENIRTSGGYGLEHNKQYYDENGEPTTKTEKGTDNPDDYSLTIRNERTAGRNGGGIQMSFTGDGERPIGEILPD